MQHDNIGFLTFLFPIFLVQPFKHGQKLKTLLADTLLTQTMYVHRPTFQHTLAARINQYWWSILGCPIKKHREGLRSTGCIIFFYVLFSGGGRRGRAWTDLALLLHSIALIHKDLRRSCRNKSSRFMKRKLYRECLSIEVQFIDTKGWGNKYKPLLFIVNPQRST